MEAAAYRYPWRPLGALLVERGLLTADELEDALAEQERTGALLGEILVGGCYVSAFSLTRTLADQHGVELRERPQPVLALRPGAAAHRGARPWRPLGKLLVEGGLVSPEQLSDALREQADGRGRLGEILVARGHLSGTALARALADQHGIDADNVPELDDDLETAVRPARPEQPSYQLWASPGALLYDGTNFLDAADLASELVAHGSTAHLELRRVRGGRAETVWTHGDGTAPSRPTLVATFGFDPTRWGVRR